MSLCQCPYFINQKTLASRYFQVEKRYINVRISLANLNFLGELLE